MPYFGSQENAYRYMRRGPVKGGYLFTNVGLAMLACVLTRRVFGRILPLILRDLPREVAEDLVKHTWRSSTSSLWEVVYRYDAADDLSRIPEHISVLFIHGDRDLMAPLVAVERLLAMHPRWHLRVLKGIDHHPFLRDPQACLELITRERKAGE
jgi:pimeloyl-ACP methyl ester carboxylesterase